jgi:hypothetical protein
MNYLKGVDIFCFVADIKDIHPDEKDPLAPK